MFFIVLFFLPTCGGGIVRQITRHKGDGHRPARIAPLGGFILKWQQLLRISIAFIKLYIYDFGDQTHKKKVLRKFGPWVNMNMNIGFFMFLFRCFFLCTQDSIKNTWVPTGMTVVSPRYASGMAFLAPVFIMFFYGMRPNTAMFFFFVFLLFYCLMPNGNVLAIRWYTQNLADGGRYRGWCNFMWFPCHTYWV